jgi:uncharacterized Fe-S cluster-containing radical SAM superfamily protein
MKSLRLLVTLDCNLGCGYCCNNRPEVKSQFKKKSEIDYGQYKDVCITGGEPFLDKEYLFNILDEIPDDTTFYLYSNGLLINWMDAFSLCEFYQNFGGISVTIHSIRDYPKIAWIYPFMKDKVRWRVQDTKLEQLYESFPETRDMVVKTWTDGICHVPNEDWVVLE